jgi:hypothetical protein
VYSVYGIPRWTDYVDLDPDEVYLYAKVIGPRRKSRSSSSVIALAFPRIVDHLALQNIEVYVNSKDQNPPHIHARATDGTVARFLLDGTIYKEHTMSNKRVAKVSEFIKSHQAAIKEAYDNIVAGNKYVMVKK